MAASTTVILVGASVRAAAFSARRVGLRPWCLDLFADADLQAIGPAMAVASADYPRGLPALVRTHAPPGPVFYTGGLENHPAVVEELARDRPLWGTPAAALPRIRDPFACEKLWRRFDLVAPRVAAGPEGLPVDGTWLTKPRSSAGGRGIRPWRGGPLAADHFWQEYLVGQPAALIFDSDAGRWLGGSWQLLGSTAPWTHAGPFAYAGSLAWGDGWPRLGEELAPAAEACLLRDMDRLAQALRTLPLVGVVGVDVLIRDDGRVIPIEINPRYTASMEVVERACPMVRVLARGAPPPPPGVAPPSAAAGRVWGKAVYFSPGTGVFPAEGPWLADLAAVRHDPLTWPAWADIPRPGTVLVPGDPVLTYFAAGDSLSACRQRLAEIAADLDRGLAFS